MKKISGTFTALITPFKNYNIDFETFNRFVEWQLSQGIDGVVVAGTTAEAATFEDAEYVDLIRNCVTTVSKRKPVIAGTGFNSTKKTVEITQKAEYLGADYALIVMPYYNRPSERGVFEHFKTIHDNSTIPIILYDIPFRTGLNVSVDLLAEIAALPRVVAIKDSTFDLSKPVKLKEKVSSDFILMSGDDDTSLAYMAQGGKGVISVISNIAPAITSKMHNLFLAGETEKANELCVKMNFLRKAVYSENSPTAVKYIASKLGICENELRLPNVPLSKDKQLFVDNIINDYKLPSL